MILSFKNRSTERVWLRERISEIVGGRRAITTDTALRLSKALGVDERFWINLQIDYDLEVARERHAEELARVTRLVSA